MSPTKPQLAILADLAGDDYGLWEMTGKLSTGLQVDYERDRPMAEDELRTSAHQALIGLLEDAWVQFYVTDEPHGERPQVLRKERALSLMDENAPWVAPMFREEGPYVHLEMTSDGRERWFTPGAIDDP